MELNTLVITALATGLALGVGIGLMAGKRHARTMLRCFLQRKDISIRDTAGKPVPLDVFLEAASEMVDDRQSRRTTWLYMVGVVVLVGAMVLIGCLR